MAVARNSRYTPPSATSARRAEVARNQRAGLGALNEGTSPYARYKLGQTAGMGDAMPASPMRALGTGASDVARTSRLRSAAGRVGGASRRVGDAFGNASRRVYFGATSAMNSAESGLRRGVGRASGALGGMFRRSGGAGGAAAAGASEVIRPDAYIIDGMESKVTRRGRVKPTGRMDPRRGLSAGGGMGGGSAGSSGMRFGRGVGDRFGDASRKAYFGVTSAMNSVEDRIRGLFGRGRGRGAGTRGGMGGSAAGSTGRRAGGQLALGPGPSSVSPSVGRPLALGAGPQPIRAGGAAGVLDAGPRAPIALGPGGGASGRMAAGRAKAAAAARGTSGRVPIPMGGGAAKVMDRQSGTVGKAVQNSNKYLDFAKSRRGALMIGAGAIGLGVLLGNRRERGTSSGAQQGRYGY